MVSMSVEFLSDSNPCLPFLNLDWSLSVKRTISNRNIDKVFVILSIKTLKFEVLEKKKKSDID